MDIPFKITNSKIGRITLKVILFTNQIPTSYKKIQGEILIENVEINIIPITEQNLE
jgi:hypothetical protein